MNGNISRIIPGYFQLEYESNVARKSLRANGSAIRFFSIIYMREKEREEESSLCFRIKVAMRVYCVSANEEET